MPEYAIEEQYNTLKVLPKVNHENDLDLIFAGDDMSHALDNLARWSKPGKCSNGALHKDVYKYTIYLLEKTDHMEWTVIGYIKAKR